MRLTAIRDQLDNLLDEAARHELTLRETLVLLCEREVARDARRIEMANKIAHFLGVREPDGISEPSPSVVLQLLEAAMDESREQLQDLWARLLADSMVDGGSKVRHDFFGLGADPFDLAQVQAEAAMPTVSPPSDSGNRDRGSASSYRVGGHGAVRPPNLTTPGLNASRQAALIFEIL